VWIGRDETGLYSWDSPQDEAGAENDEDPGGDSQQPLLACPEMSDGVLNLSHSRLESTFSFEDAKDFGKVLPILDHTLFLVSS